MIKIDKKQFHAAVKKLLKDSTLQKIETEDFIFIRPNGTITVKFKKIDHLTGLFTFEEMKNWKTLLMILKTLETEINKKTGGKYA